MAAQVVSPFPYSFTKIALTSALHTQTNTRILLHYKMFSLLVVLYKSLSIDIFNAVTHRREYLLCS